MQAIPLIAISTLGYLSISFDLFIADGESSLLKNGLAFMHKSNMQIM